MKIHFDNCNFSSNSGPNSFATRLAKGFFESGHEVVEHGPDADISIVFIERSGRPLAEKKVLRLDGVWFKPNEFYTRNTAIKYAYDASDAIVFQSNFDKKFITKWWPTHKKNAVIHNGINDAKCTKFTIAALEQIRNKYKLVFCSSANWHPQKRLNENVKLFKHIRETIEPSSCLIVMGPNPTMTSDNDIFYTGFQSHEVCAEVYSSANWMLHLAYLDHCPNVVVEAMNQSTPIICSSEGGTKELVGDFGIVLKEKEYDFSLTDYDNPPEIDVTQLTTLPIKNQLGNHLDITMETCVENYISLFKQIL